MRVTRLELHNFRNYTDLSIEPGPARNVLIGKNAQGKSTVLEAIYLLATSKSWRAGKDSELVKWDAEHARVFAEVVRDEQNDAEIEVLLGRSDRKQITVNTIRQTKLADLMGQVNVVLIEPQDSEIIRGDPRGRRKFLNLEISQIQPQYLHLLVSYRKVLEQRNRLLKELHGRRSGDGVLDVWNEQLVAYGSRILERRLEFVSRISKIVQVIHAQITEGVEALGVKYASSTDLAGAETANDIAEGLRKHLEEVRVDEIQRGVTLVGPQRDDLIFTINGVDARVYGSQGQQRSIALSLRLAELEVMEETAGEPPVVLLDDVMTDLDEERRAHVFQMTEGRCQTFITSASKRVFDSEFLHASTVFRVSEGKVSPE